MYGATEAEKVGEKESIIKREAREIKSATFLTTFQSRIIVMHFQPDVGIKVGASNGIACFLGVSERLGSHLT